MMVYSKNVTFIYNSLYKDKTHKNLLYIYIYLHFSVNMHIQLQLYTQ